MIEVNNSAILKEVCGVADKNIKINLASSMVEKWREDLIRDGMDNITVNSIINEGMKKIISSPVLIIAFLDMSEMMKYPDKRRRQAEYTMGIQSVAASIENLLLTATANGLGACWLCAPLFCKEIVKNALNVPSYFDPQALITLGYPDESPNIPKRKIINEIVKFNYWR